MAGSDLSPSSSQVSIRLYLGNCERHRQLLCSRVLHLNPNLAIFLQEHFTFFFGGRVYEWTVAAVTKYCTLGAENNRNSFTVLEARVCNQVVSKAGFFSLSFFLSFFFDRVLL